MRTAAATHEAQHAPDPAVVRAMAAAIVETMVDTYGDDMSPAQLSLVLVHALGLHIASSFVDHGRVTAMTQDILPRSVMTWRLLLADVPAGKPS